jgi:glycosyltransferase involved in cell wall biosynthesis
MRVLMLGWEFPPFITGGLGTACYGLTKALDRRSIGVTFVLPRHVEGETTSHVTLISPATEWQPGTPIARAAHVEPAAPLERQEPAAAQAGRAAGLGGSWDAVSTALMLGGSESLIHDELEDDFEEAAAEAAAEGGDGVALGLHASAGLAIDPAAPHLRALRQRSILRRCGHLGPYGLGADSLAAAALRQMRHGSAATSPAGGRLSSARFLAQLSGALDSASVREQTLVAERALRAAIPEAHGQSNVHFIARREDYGGDLVGDAYRYARFVVAACARLPFDVIHAHDWLTYPAGLALASVTGRPLVAHVHSTEFDRSGLHVNQRIYDIERRGMHGAIKVISVSMLTKNLCINRYSMPASKIDVVYNGVDLSPEQVGMEDIQAKDKIVLYFGRITMQKGPEYFVHAAKRVLEVYKDVKFVVAGSGDQAQRMIEMAAALGIGHKLLFTGFLRGKDIARVFAIADLYVMPSVSEPFGIAPLEAMSHDVPVLISRTSGVSEVLTNALKCDFWDVTDMANKIVAVLRHPPLQRTLIEHGRFEVRKLTWDGAAARCEDVYRQVLKAFGS